MPDEARSLATRLAAWWRRGYDAELLAVAPTVDEGGQPLVWDFTHPVNRSPAWRLLRPWVHLPVIFVVAPLCLSMWGRGRLFTLAELGPRLVLFGVVAAVLGTAIHRRQRPRVERLALKAYHRWRWRGTALQDAAIAAALERERTPKRLMDAPPRPGDR
jgi:hypothetical protein